ncbi:uncharacterized protein LOC106644921 [Copidosoma floridanum]|uniref:uncharacterized protein LOC106644921 n=1 Tax=Copidosoma floridanum TaxID=29053 RepID=UPI0006C997EE|nr:uncharacterized protein LOC106644921 [Copidosoma floridanum]
MPRPARVKCETIFENLKDLDIFDENGMLKKRKDLVWTEAIKRMPEINLHNLYLFVYQDRRDIKTNLMKYKNIDCIVPKKKCKKENKKEPISNYDELWDDPDFYETLDNESNPDALSDFDTMITIKESDQYKNTIQKIAVLPFSVIYWHPYQISLWSDLINIESTVSMIVLDNIISNIKGNFETSHIYLYALAVKLDSTIILLSQMMSDSVNSLEIQYFLDSWLQGGASVPSEFVCGYSYSLLDAASLSFNFCSYDQYNLKCFKCLMDEIIVLPPTLIQIDIHVLIKVINGWSCFENVSQAVKDLYLCGVIYLSSLQSLEEFRETVISMLSLCQSPYQNEEIERRRLDLWTQLTSDTIQQMNREYLTLATGKNSSRSFAFYNIRQNPVISETPHDIYEYINQLKQAAYNLGNFNLDGSEVANEYYCPIVLENLVQLLIEFPSWTKIFVKKRDNATLVSTCAFKHLTTLTELKEPVSPPQFFMYHHEKLGVLMHQGRFSINKLKNKIGISERKSRSSQNHAHLSQEVVTSSIMSKSFSSPSSINHLPHSMYDSRSEINVPTEDLTVPVPVLQHISEILHEVPQTNNTHAGQARKPASSHHKPNELDLLDLKSAVNSAICSLLDFDEYVSNVLLPLVKPGFEPAICKTLLDCCMEMKTYEYFIGNIVERFCIISEGFSTAFKTLFIECYNTAEVMDKNEIKNSSKLFAHLLQKDSISWDCFNAVKINERDTTLAKKNFIRILLQELADQKSASSLEERFKDKEYKTAFKGLFPTESRKDAAFAANFYKSIGLKTLRNMLKVTTKKALASEKVFVDNLIQKRSPSVSSNTSDSSSDFIFELRVKKKNGKKCTSSKRKTILM